MKPISGIYVTICYVIGFAAFLARFPLRYSLGLCMAVAAVTQAAFSLGMFNDLGALAIPSVVAIIVLVSGAMFATNPIFPTVPARFER